MPKWLTVSLLIFSLLLVALGIAFYPSNPSKQPVSAQPTVKPNFSIHIMGTIDPDPLLKQQQFAPLLEYLNDHLAEYKIRLIARVAKTPEELEKLIKNNQLHWVIDSPAPISKASLSNPLVPRLIRHKNNRSTYYSVIVARKDSGINQLSDLIGKTLGIENQWSTSTYALPSIGFEDAHVPYALTPVDPTKSVTFVSTGDEEISIYEVLAGNLSAAAIKSVRYEELPDARFSELKVIYQSSPVPRQILASTAGLPPNEVERIIQELINASQFPKGKKALKKFGQTSGFSLIEDPEMLQKLLDRLALVQ